METEAVSPVLLLGLFAMYLPPTTLPLLLLFRFPTSVLIARLPAH